MSISWSAAPNAPSRTIRTATAIRFATPAVWTGIAKLTLRPADGHQVKFGYIHYDTDCTTG
jgi:hypothetical protein